MAQTQEQIDLQREREEHRASLLPFFWSLTLHRYVWTATGQVVAYLDIRNWVDDAVFDTKAWALRRTWSLINKRISFETWITELRAELKAMHTGLAEIAIGGNSQWGAVEAGRLGARLRQQYMYLDRLGREVESGFQKLDGTLLNRVGLFVESGRHTYENMRRGMMMDVGFTEEMRTLGPSHHCNDCPPISGFWAPLGSLPALGDTACMSNCACTYQFR